MARPAPQAPVRHCHSRGRGARPCHRLLPRAAGYHKRRRTGQGVSGGWRQCTVHGHHQGQLRDPGGHSFSSTKASSSTKTSRRTLATTCCSARRVDLSSPTPSPPSMPSELAPRQTPPWVSTVESSALTISASSYPFSTCARATTSQSLAGLYHPPAGVIRHGRRNLGLRPRRRPPRRRDSPFHRDNRHPNRAMAGSRGSRRIAGPSRPTWSSTAPPRGVRLSLRWSGLTCR